MTTPILKKSQIRKVGGSGHIHETRKYTHGVLGKETCTNQTDLKKKIGQIFK